MSKQKNKINWKEVWKKFDRWYDRVSFSLTDDWEDQQKEIQKLVEAQLNEEKK